LSTHQEIEWQLSQIAEPNAEVVVTELEDGEAVLLHLKTRMYYSLNDTGRRIWHLLAEGLTLQAVSERLQSEYEVTPEKAVSSVISLVDDLISENLISLRG
jgi:uncharacterized protein YpbB